MADYSIESLLEKCEYVCPVCGKVHKTHLKAALIKSGALNDIPAFVGSFNAKMAYIICDNNTFNAAGKKVTDILAKNGIDYKLFMLKGERPEPDEYNVGSAVLNFDKNCDIIIGVGSGVVNDTGKIVASMTKLPYIIVGTAPSMDGYASGTSSVIRDSLKVSVDSVCPDVVIGDLDILCNSPVKMICSGLGDMLAKYVSICEWRIGNVVTGEYFCEEIASIIRCALKKCVDSAEGILSRDPEAVKSVMEGMIISGIAADYAGVSRPVSGCEHYFSHIWDMRALEFGTPWDFHGIQCGIGTVLTLKGYEYLKEALKSQSAEVRFDFDVEKWNSVLKEKLGKASEAIIALENKEQKYAPVNHRTRLEKIQKNTDKILKIIEEELPSSEFVEELLKSINAPTKPSDIGIPDNETTVTFNITKDIRFKYILSTLFWDLGLSDKAEEIYKNKDLKCLHFRALLSKQ